MIKSLIVALLGVVAATAGPVFQFNPASPYVPNRGVAIFWEHELRTQVGTNYVRLTNPPPVFWTNAIEFTKMSNGLCVALTSTESNLIVSMTASNANWSLLNSMTNEIRAAEALYQQSNFMAMVVKANALLTIDRFNLWRPAGSNIVTTNGYLIQLTNVIRSLRQAP